MIEKFKDYVIPLFDETEYINIKNKYKWRCVKCGNEFEQHIHKDQFDGQILYIPRCLNCFPHLNGSSLLEKEVLNFIKSIYNGEIIENDKKLIYPNELDIVIPEFKLAIEFNGLYWHSKKNADYHLNKTELCNSKDYQLIHIFEDEWLYKQEIVKDIIKSKLGIYDKKIYARDCKVRDVNSNEAKQFLEENNIFGNDKSNMQIGLFYDNELISIISFQINSVTAILTRFNNKLGIQVIGGLSRLIKAFKRKLGFKIEVNIDRRYFNGKNFEKIGFRLDYIKEPNSYYINRNKRYKDKISDINLKIYDAGELKYIKE
jgi:hypothetical protein